MTPAARTACRAAILGGLVAGTVDIGSAMLIFHLGPVPILHSIGGGLLGRASFRMGLSSALLGLALQWLMSILIAAIFVAACRRAPELARRWVAAGLAYGVAVYVVMNYVVVPLSAYHRFPPPDPGRIAANLLAMLLFGLIVAFFARPLATVPPRVMPQTGP